MERRSLRGNVDRNNPLDGKGCKNSSRSLRGNVDRNNEYHQYENYANVVVPYVGTWIEIVSSLTPRQSNI